MAMLTSPGKLDEASAKVKLLRLPGQIKRIDRNTVTAQPRAGIKSLKPEGLRLGGVDDFKEVDVHALTELFELIYQRYVDAAVDVFKQLGHLRCRR